MAAGNQIREFLTSRRAKITPDQAGLSAYGTRRRVPGLRREEVAALAGVSVEYYAQLERGAARGVSDDVLHAIAGALQLDDAERTHLFDLARTASARSSRRRPTPPRVRPSVQRALDTIGVPALVRNGRLDLLAVNRQGRALYGPVFDSPGPPPPNIARFAFLDSNAAGFYADWDDYLGDCVAVLRAEAGRNPHDKDLSDLVGELSTGSDEFRVRWASHNVKLYRTGRKQLRHPVVGEVTIEMEVFELPRDPGQTLVIFTPEPGSPSEEALGVLASSVATPRR